MSCHRSADGPRARSRIAGCRIQPGRRSVTGRSRVARLSFDGRVSSMRGPSSPAGAQAYIASLAVSSGTWSHRDQNGMSSSNSAVEPSGRCRGRSAAPPSGIARLQVGAAAAPAAQHLHLAGNNLGVFLVVARLVLPLAGLQAAFDIHLVGLAQVFGGDLAEAVPPSPRCATRSALSSRRRPCRSSSRGRRCGCW